MSSVKLKKNKSKFKFMNNMMDDEFHPDDPICQIVSTSAGPKQDTFASFRPGRLQCLDYNISQTDTKLDAGPTKIHYQHTEATYVPDTTAKPLKPRFKRKIRYFRGGPPRWLFCNEKWRREQELKQKLYIETVRDRQNTRRREHWKHPNQHYVILNKVGPAWFQELSPKQLATVDNLKNCIIKDYNEGTIINTQENIAYLGLVLRPNHRHIERALKNCCKCPIEFLLILYQLINPQREEYSINDRLLLSAVVHLTMRDTLRELHVRIPSPPPPQKKVKKPPKKQKKYHYDSPYLEPFTFKREPFKFTGTYRNKHVQYPESPYFSYLEEFRRCLAENTLGSNVRKEASGIIRREISGTVVRSELSAAKVRSKLTIIEEPDEEIMQELEYAQTVYEELVDYRPVRRLLAPSRYTPCDNFRTRAAALEEKQKLEQIEEKEESPEVSEGKEESSQRSKGDQRCVCDVSQNCCEEDIAEDSIQADKFLESVKSEPSEAPTCVCKTPSCLCKAQLSTETNSVKIEPPKNVCECKDENLKLIEKPPCPCEKCQEERRRKTTTLVIAGTKETGSEETVRIIDGLVVEKPCKCLKTYDTRVQKYEDYQKRIEAVVRMKEQENKFIIGGVVNTPQGPVFVISGMRPPIDCICAKQAREDEAERKRLANMPHIPPGRVKFGIGGVKETPKGNVYIIDHTIPIEDCDCMKVYDRFETEHTTCLKIYEGYLCKMKDDINEFMDDLLPSSRKASRGEVPEEVNVFEQNVEQIKRVSDKLKHIEGEDESLEKTLEPDEELQNETEPIETLICTCADETKTLDSGSVSEQPDDTSPTKKTCKRICRKRKCKKKKVSKCCPCCGKKLRLNCADCTCGFKQVVPCIDCTCGPPVESVVEEEEIEEEEKQLKRFFIFKKILCDVKWQMTVLKSTLESMADDGFPLAKLPNCYKLPHFKLWMQMRCGKFWTQKDRYDYVLKSMLMWKHTEYCKRRVPLAKLPISLRKAKLLTWADAAYCRKIVTETIDAFYRKVRQVNVDSGREFYPTTYSYEFPFSTYRNSHFAYIPAKEEDVLAVFVWQRFECKDVADWKPCC